MRNHKARNLIVFCVMIIGVFLLIAFCSGTGNDGTVSPAPAPSENSWKEGQNREADRPETKEPKERDDVTKMKLDMTTQYGVTESWVHYSITNHSSKESSYEVEYEVISKATGDRVYNSWVYESDVRPGQTVTGKDMPMLDNNTDEQDYTVNLTRVERMADYG